MEYEIKGWEGYFLNITEHSIDVYSSWGFSSGRPLKGQKREIVIIENKRKKISQRISKQGYIRLDLNVGITGKKQVFLHRLIAETLIPNPYNLECVDHIDGNKQNNRIENLRETNQSLNTANSVLSKANTSGYKGVVWRKDTKKWMAQIVKDRKRYGLGSFDNIEDAANAYKVAAEKFFGEFARPEKVMI